MFETNPKHRAVVITAPGKHKFACWICPTGAPQTVSTVLQECGNNIDAAIRRLGELRLTVEDGSAPAEQSRQGPATPQANAGTGTFCETARCNKADAAALYVLHGGSPRWFPLLLQPTPSFLVSCQHGVVCFLPLQGQTCRQRMPAGWSSQLQGQQPRSSGWSCWWRRCPLPRTCPMPSSERRGSCDSLRTSLRGS